MNKITSEVYDTVRGSKIIGLADGGGIRIV